MSGFRAWRALVPAIILLGAMLGITPAALSQSKSDVERAREEAEQALARLREVGGRLEAANLHYQQVNAELEEVSFRVLRLTDTIGSYEGQARDLRRKVEERAVEAYMEGGTGLVGLVLEAASMNEVITGQEFLQRAAEQDLDAVNRLAATRADMDRARRELQKEQARLEVLRAEAEAARLEMEEAFAEADALYREADAEFREVQAQYEAELRRQRLAALAQARGSAAGAPAASTPGFICPMNPPISFINDWGFPRSGGRTHQGTDIFAPYGHPVLAVADGSMRVSNSGLGGLGIWLSADHGTAYFYAHLSGIAPGLGGGGRVAKGQVIGYNGNSGNASGGSAHVHFEIHPGGGAALNPYPTLVNSC